jgi:hypothetical protein
MTLSQKLDYLATMIGWQVNEDEYTRKNIYALNGIRTHGLSFQPIDREPLGWPSIVIISSLNTILSLYLPLEPLVYPWTIHRLLFYSCFQMF